MNPNQMPTQGDWREPTIEEKAQRVKKARRHLEALQMMPVVEDEIQRMRNRIALERAKWELDSAEEVLRLAVREEN